MQFFLSATTVPSPRAAVAERSPSKSAAERKRRHIQPSPSEGRSFITQGRKTMRRKLGRAEIKGVSVISYDLVDVGVIFMKFRAPQALKDIKK
jgi:hypothetical protein